MRPIPLFHELQRYNWSMLRAMGSAAHVPAALYELTCADNSEIAERAYWRIDNVVVVQGSLYEAALPTVIGAISGLQHCTDSGRLYLLELLVIIGSGVTDPSEIVAGNSRLHENCLREIIYGLAIYINILEHGRSDAMMWAVDLLGLCAYHEPSVRERVVWWFHQLLQRELAAEDRRMIEATLQDLSLTQ